MMCFVARTYIKNVLQILKQSNHQIIIISMNFIRSRAFRSTFYSEKKDTKISKTYEH